MSKLNNVKWELFAKTVALGLSYSDAYRKVYNAKGKAVSVSSSALMAKPSVRARVEELREDPAYVDYRVSSFALKRNKLYEVITGKDTPIKDLLNAIRLDAQLMGEFAPTEHRRLELSASIGGEEFTKRLAAVRQDLDKTVPGLSHSKVGEGGSKGKGTITTLDISRDNITKGKDNDRARDNYGNDKDDNVIDI